MEPTKKASTLAAKQAVGDVHGVPTAHIGAAAVSHQDRPSPQVWSKYVDSRMKQFGTR
jgi:hypothetical protein